jgi:hypothetical protein
MLRDWVEEELKNSILEFGMGVEDDVSSADKTTLEDFQRELARSFIPPFGLAMGFCKARSWDMSISAVSRAIKSVLWEINSRVPKSRLNDAARNIDKGWTSFVEGRQVYFLKPPMFRTHPRVGTAAVGSTDQATKLYFF